MRESKGKAERHDAIAAAAGEVFYREGFAQVGIDRVAERAGVALATLYRHYPGRAALVIAALQDRERSFFAALDSASEGLRGEARILSLFGGLGRWAEARGGNGCFFLRAAGAHPDDPAIRAVVFAHKRAYLEVVRRRLLEGGYSAKKAEQLAPALFLLLEGAVASAGFMGDEAAVSAALAAGKRLLRA